MKFNYKKNLNRFKESNYTIAEFSNNLGKKGFIILKDKKPLSNDLHKIKAMSSIYNLDMLLEAMELFSSKQEAENSLTKLKIEIGQQEYQEKIKIVD